MFIPPQKTFEELSRPAAEAFRFWISFWPAAPLFGVEWRFAEAARGLAPAKVAGAAQAAARTQTRAAEAMMEAPAIAAPVAEEALKSQPRKTEPAIEQTLEPEAPKQAEPKQASPKQASPKKASPKQAEPKQAEPKGAEKTETKATKPDAAEAKPRQQAPKEPLPVVEPEVPVEQAAERNLKLDLAPGDGLPERPKGLLKTPPKEVDDLKMIKGIGPGLESQLNGLGVYKYRQIANFTDQDLAWIDAKLTAFKGRCFRDDWIGQAKALLA